MPILSGKLLVKVESGLHAMSSHLLKRVVIEDEERRLRIYPACILDKSKDLDMSAELVLQAVEDNCKAISENPSFLDRFWYD